jgi:hypothetical protein
LAPYLKLIKEKPTAYSFYPALATIVDNMKVIASSREKTHDFLISTTSQVFDAHLIKEPTILLEGIKLQLAITLMMKSLTCWSNKLEIITSKFLVGGDLYLNDSSQYDWILNNNNLGESIVALLSKSVKSAPGGSESFHQSMVKLRRNKFPTKTFVTTILRSKTCCKANKTKD